VKLTRAAAGTRNPMYVSVMLVTLGQASLRWSGTVPGSPPGTPAAEPRSAPDI